MDINKQQFDAMGMFLIIFPFLEGTRHKQTAI